MDQTKIKDQKKDIDSRQLIVFKQGDEEYGLLIDQIKEVVITPNITKIPQTPEFIKGVANIRGNVIAVIDLEQKFGIRKEDQPADQVKKRNYTLVVESDEFKVGILVNEVPNTLSISTSDIEESINLVQDEVSGRNYVKGVVSVKEKLIILIDIFKVLSESELQLTIQKSAS